MGSLHGHIYDADTCLTWVSRRTSPCAIRRERRGAPRESVRAPQLLLLWQVTLSPPQHESEAEEPEEQLLHADALEESSGALLPRVTCLALTSEFPMASRSHALHLVSESFSGLDPPRDGFIVSLAMCEDARSSPMCCQLGAQHTCPLAECT